MAKKSTSKRKERRRQMDLDEIAGGFESLEKVSGHGRGRGLGLGRRHASLRHKGPRKRSDAVIVEAVKETDLIAKK